jgi:DNA-binding CsgD family transcriptional regulator
MTLDLSTREMEIIKLLCEAKVNKEIAAHLNISEKTVETHRTNIYRKVGVDSIVKLVLWALGDPQVSLSSILNRSMTSTSRKGESIASEPIQNRISAVSNGEVPPPQLGFVRRLE